MDKCIVGGWMDKCIDGYMYRLILYMDGWMDRWLGGDTWMDG